MWEWLFLPFLGCMILTGIHAYLGLHIIQRGVIFVDLALAQMAALGALVGFVCGVELHSTMSYVFSFGFTVVGAGIFALTKHLKTSAPQEALIGIVYAMAAAVSILILEKAPAQAHEIKDMLVGRLLFVEASDLWRMGVLYALVALFHFLCRKPFYQLSFQPDLSLKRATLWDFLFYVSLGLVVTSSVAVGGVLLVFTYLIVPAVAALWMAKTLKNRLLWGWILGGISSCLGLWISVKADLPTGATIVCSFGGILVLLGLYQGFRNLYRV